MDFEKQQKYKQKYLYEWVVPSTLFEIALEYMYNCEKFDQETCTGGYDEWGCAIPLTLEERKESYQNAIKEWKKARFNASECGYSVMELNNELEPLNRLTWEGLQKEYSALQERKQKAGD